VRSLVGSYWIESLMLTGLHSLQFPGSYLLSSTDSCFYMRLNYTQFFTFESSRNSPALQLLGSHYPRVPKKFQSAKCPSNVIRTKFPTPAFTKHLIEFCWTSENSWTVCEVWCKTVAEFMSFQAPPVFRPISLHLYSHCHPAPRLLESY
jgi:hypothetical protein